MSAEDVRERKEKRKYTFVIVPDVKSEKTKTLSITRFGLFSLIFGSLLIIVAFILAIEIYTPVGRYIPISNPELIKYYEKEIFEISKQMQHFIREIMVLRNYNLRLRKIMGEQISPEDSLFMLTSGVDTFLASKFKIEENDTSVSPMVDEEPYIPVQSSLQLPVTHIAQENQFNSNIETYFPLLLPVNGYITRDYEPEKFHNGIDIASRQKSPVFAAANGTVVFANWTYEDGFMMIITHDYGIMTVYKHNYSLLKNVGDIVKCGEIVALLGNTGEKSSGPHLHFEVWKNGIVQNPNNYLLSIN